MFVMENKPNSKLFGWNSKYVGSFQGILNICEIVICYASMQLLRDTCRPAYSSSAGGFVGSGTETFFYLCTCASMIITCILLFAFVISHISCALMERTVLGVMFWTTCSALCFLTSAALLFYVNSPNSVEIFGYSHKIAAVILGFINSALYLINAIKSYRICKNCWSYQCKS